MGNHINRDLTPQNQQARDYTARIIKAIRASGIRIQLASQEDIVKISSDAELMGTTVEKRRHLIAGIIDRLNISPEDKTILSLFAGIKNKETMSFHDVSGKSRTIIFMQGNERRAGIKHSLYRHNDTNKNNYSADELLLVSKVLKEGRREQKGKKISYKVIVNGVQYTVTSEIYNGKESFTNFYTNRKPTEAVIGSSYTETPHAQQQLVSDAKVQNNSDDTKDLLEIFHESDKKIYGWHDKDGIHIAKDGFNPDTPVHEYTHCYMLMLREKDPKTYKDVVDALKGDKTWQEVIDDENYIDYAENEAKIASEVAARLTGAESERRAYERLSDKILRSLKAFWDGVRNLLGQDSPINVKKFTDRVLTDLDKHIDVSVSREDIDVEYSIVNNPGKKSVNDEKGELIIKGVTYSREELETALFQDVQEIIEESDLEDEIKVTRVSLYGSRADRFNREDSDIDVLVEYDSDNWREDSLYNLLKEEKHYINGVEIDFNPISLQKTGTIEEYLQQPHIVKYREEKMKEIHESPLKENNINKENMTTKDQLKQDYSFVEMKKPKATNTWTLYIQPRDKEVIKGSITVVPPKSEVSEYFDAKKQGEDVFAAKKLELATKYMNAAKAYLSNGGSEKTLTEHLNGLVKQEIKTYSKDKETQALEMFTEMLIQKIEQSDGNWQKPWFTEGAALAPRNAYNGEYYKGGNSFLLMMAASKFGYETPLWITSERLDKYNCTIDKDGKRQPLLDAEGNKLPLVSIKKGEKAFPVYHTHFVVVHKETKEKIKMQDYMQLPKEQKELYNVFPKQKLWPVFNLDQTNLKEVRPELYQQLVDKYMENRPQRTPGDMNSHPAIDKMIDDNLWMCPINQVHGDNAYYSPARDIIVVPERSQFKDGEAFATNTLHECAHSLGADSRLNRGFGDRSSKAYATEELVAEMSACFVASRYGLVQHMSADTASYLKSWLGSLKESPKFIKTVLSDVDKCTKELTARIDEVQEQLNRGLEADYTKILEHKDPFVKEKENGNKEEKNEQVEEQLSAKDIPAPAETESVEEKPGRQSPLAEEAEELYKNLLTEKLDAIQNDWKEPWFKDSVSWPVNLSGREYNAKNAATLMLHSEKQGYELPVFMTFDRLNVLNYKKDKQGKQQVVRDGEGNEMPKVTLNPNAKGIPITVDTYRVVNPETKEKISYDTYRQMPETERVKYNVTVHPQYYKVYNIADTNLKEVRPELYQQLKDKVLQKEGEQYEKSIDVFSKIDNMIKADGWVCPIKPTPGNDSYYSISKDEIVLPEKIQYKSTEAFYTALFHEMAHSTGSESRLDRLKPTTFGSREYSREELKVELTAALLSKQLGLEKPCKEDSLPYLKSWKDIIQEEPDFMDEVLKDVRKAYRYVDHEFSVYERKQQTQELKKELVEDNTLKREIHVSLSTVEDYHDQKKKYPDGLMLFDKEGTYEVYSSDAEIVSKTLGLELMESKGIVDKDGKPFKILSFDKNELGTNLIKLTRAGYQIGICSPKDTNEKKDYGAEAIQGMKGYIPEKVSESQAQVQEEDYEEEQTRSRGMHR